MVEISCVVVQLVEVQLQAGHLRRIRYQVSQVNVKGKADQNLGLIFQVFNFYNNIEIIKVTAEIWEHDYIKGQEVKKRQVVICVYEVLSLICTSQELRSNHNWDWIR